MLAYSYHRICWVVYTVDRLINVSGCIARLCLSTVHFYDTHIVMCDHMWMLETYDSINAIIPWSTTHGSSIAVHSDGTWDSTIWWCVGELSTVVMRCHRQLTLQRCNTQLIATPTFQKLHLSQSEFMPARTQDMSILRFLQHTVVDRLISWLVFMVRPFAELNICNMRKQVNFCSNKARSCLVHEW